MSERKKTTAKRALESRIINSGVKKNDNEMNVTTRKTNGALNARRWQQVKAERDDLPLFAAPHTTVM